MDHLPPLHHPFKLLGTADRPRFTMLVAAPGDERRPARGTNHGVLGREEHLAADHVVPLIAVRAVHNLVDHGRHATRPRGLIGAGVERKPIKVTKRLMP